MAHKSQEFTTNDHRHGYGLISASRRSSRDKMGCFGYGYGNIEGKGHNMFYMQRQSIKRLHNAYSRSSKITSYRCVDGTGDYGGYWDNNKGHRQNNDDNKLLFWDQNDRVYIGH